MIRYQKAPYGRKGTDVSPWQCTDGIFAPWDGPFGFHEENVPFYCVLRDRHTSMHEDSYGRKWHSDGMSTDVDWRSNKAKG